MDDTMDYNESLRRTLHFERPERICQFEWGYWPETLDRWRREGMVGDNPWDDLPITYYHRAPVETRIFPPFESELLSETPTTRIIRDGWGITREESKVSTALPRFLKHPVENLADFERIRERLDPTDERRFPSDWEEQARELRGRNSILVLGACEISFFGWHRDLMGVQNLLLAYYDQPELIHAISRYHLDFLRTLYGKILEHVEGDFVFLWEDMSYRNGPLISPELVREFMLPYYRELVDFFRQHGEYKFLLDSDGDVTKLIPLLVEAGIDGMLPFEVAAGMDVREIRRQWPGLILCGGIDKREIAKGRSAIDRELEAKLPFMFQCGGYLPSMDHHVPPGVSYGDFRYYLQRTRELFDEHGRG
jgi:uroporphyrinogen decarboxylase-like protein